MLRMAKARCVGFGPFCLDPLDERLWRGDATVPLGHKAFAVLACLINQPNQLVTKDDLLASVWPGTAVSEAVLTTAMREIRAAVGDTARTPRVVQTVYGRGYRFIAPVVETSVCTAVSAAAPGAGREIAAGERRIVGREIERERLQQWLAAAQQGSRRVGFICGEAGIGKTALVETLLSSIQATSDVRIARGQCIEQYGAGEAFLPLLEALGRLGQQDEALRPVLQECAPNWLAHLPSLAAEGTRTVTPVRPERMLRELTEALEAFTRDIPLVLLLEDLHWSDNATLEWLGYAARRQDAARLLVLGTYRPVEALVHNTPLRSVLADLRHQPQVAEVVLDYFPRSATEAFLRQRLGAAAHLEQLCDVLHCRTGGHPLFLSAIVDHLIASGDTRSGPAAVDPNAVSRGTPLGVRQFIETQFERLADEDQSILEAASVAGDPFAIAAVAAGTSLPVERIEARCAALTRGHRILVADGLAAWPDGTISATYRFRHALFHEAAYGRTSPERLARLHLSIGARLERAHRRRTATVAAELAVHFEQGREPDKAAAYLEQAARNALFRSAYSEAQRHLVRALEAARSLRPNRERLRREATLSLLLGHVLETTKGWGADEVAETYARAEELCTALRDGSGLLQATWGRIAVSVVRGELPQTRALARRLLALASRHRNALFRLAGHMELGGVALAQGRTAEAGRHFRAAEAIHDPSQHRSSVAAFGLDIGVFARIWATHLHWYAGRPDHARLKAASALQIADATGHPFTRTIARAYAAILFQFHADIDEVDRLTAATIADAETHGFPYYLAWARVLRGWCLAARDGDAAAIDEMRRGIDVLRSTARLRLPYYRGLLAQACAWQERHEEGLAAIAAAFDDARETGERWWDAELHRIRGGLLAARDVAEARQAFRTAIEIACSQGAKSLELKAVASLRALPARRR
jgi:DNA-binding winged helix-turn-helix (wHTH) protein